MENHEDDKCHTSHYTVVSSVSRLSAFLSHDGNEVEDLNQVKWEKQANGKMIHSPMSKNAHQCVCAQVFAPDVHAVDVIPLVPHVPCTFFNPSTAPCVLVVTPVVESLLAVFVAGGLVVGLVFVAVVVSAVVGVIAETSPSVARGIRLKIGLMVRAVTNRR